MTSSEIIRAGLRTECRPWPRYELTSDAWRSMVSMLPNEPGLAFLALWADTVQVHALLHAGAPLIASVAVEAGLYAALSPARPGAALFERMVADLWGHQAADAIDVRPWLDHGTWPMLRPLSDRPAPNAGAPEVPEMLEWDGDVLPLGPLPPGLVGPGHWRVALDGNLVRGLEARLGYAHRGIIGLMRGKSAAGAARFAARISGAATVAHALAFARAVEAALAVTPPQRALELRGIVLAIERIAVTLHDLHAVQPDPNLQTLRETLLEACTAAFGHRLMMDVVKPGGTNGELTAQGAAILDAALEAIVLQTPRWPGTIGVLPIQAARALGPSGAVGRASGRTDPAMPLAPIDARGDLAARMQMRLDALPGDVTAARTALAALPEGEAWVALPHAGTEGTGAARGPQGTVWHWVRLAGGVVTACFAADPAWQHLPAFEAAAAGTRFDTLPAVAASFGLHLAGMEL